MWAKPDCKYRLSKSSCWRPGTPNASFLAALQPSAPIHRWLQTVTLFSSSHSLIQPCWAYWCEYVCALTAQHPNIVPCLLGEVTWVPHSLHKESLVLSAEALSKTMLWVILSSSGKASRILPFMLVLFVLAAWTLAPPPILFPTINTVSAPLPLPCCLLCLPFLLLSYSSCFPCTGLSQQFTLNSSANHMAFVQLYSPLRLSPCLFCLLWVQVTAAQAGATSWCCQEEQ